MFAIFGAPARGTYRPRRRGGQEPSFWRGLALLGLLALAGLALSVLAGLSIPSDQLTVLEESAAGSLRRVTLAPDWHEPSMLLKKKRNSPQQYKSSASQSFSA